MGGIYGFSNSDVWVTAETVLQYNGTSWVDKGNGGPGSIWGASSGDMWTGGGKHLVAGQWVQQASQGSGFKKVIGASATDLFFLGSGALPYSSYLRNGSAHASDAFDGEGVVDVWPVASNDYWIVGKRRGVLQTSILHGDPASTAAAFVKSSGAPAFPAEPEVLYKTLGKVLLKKEGADFVPFKTFDAELSAARNLVWNESEVFVLAGNAQAGTEVWRFAAGVWTMLPLPAGSSPDAIQLDADGHLWLGSLYTTVPAVYVYDAASWLPLASPGLASGSVDDFVVRGHDAWLLSSGAAYRYNGSNWDAYALGIDAAVAGASINIAGDGRVYTPGPTLIFQP